MSVGPCWFEYQEGLADPYAPLFVHLDHGDPARALSAVLFQEYLWQARLKYITEIGTVISAFPSIHVAIAALAFPLFILIGSVQLGWHCAVDGYARSPAAAVVYWTLGPGPPGVAQTRHYVLYSFS